jgi:hypothetical protein
MNLPSLVRRLRRLEILFGLAVLAALVAAFRPQADAVSTRLLRVIDAQGRARFLIGAPLPDPQVQGKVYPRSRPVPGIMLLDTLGNETGGLGLFDDLQGGGLCFDYTTAEALCLTKAPKLRHLGLTLLDPPAADAQVGRTGPERLQLAVSRGTAGLVLRDPQGRVRVRLGVDSTGTPSLELLSAEGAVVRRVSEP